MRTHCSSGSFRKSSVFNSEIHAYRIITYKGIVYKKILPDVDMCVTHEECHSLNIYSILETETNT